MGLFGLFGADSDGRADGPRRESTADGTGPATDDQRCCCPGCGGCAGGLSGCSNPTVRDGLCRQCAGERADDEGETGRDDAAFETGGCGVL